MELQLEFKKPLYVSSGSEPDEVEISFRSEEIFLDKFEQPLASDTKLVQQLPMMTPDEATQELLESTETLVSSGTQGVLVANFVMQLFQGASLQYMWDMINAQ